MPYRKEKLATGSVYHVFTKSIAGFKILNFPPDFQRIRDVMSYYALYKPPLRFSLYQKAIEKGAFIQLNCSEILVKIIAYCFMPTHIHLVLQQVKDYGISEFMGVMLKSYSKYLNVRLDRKGPLWQGRFQSVLVKNDEHLLHLTRYIHLNPVTAYLVEHPEDWRDSSYGEYIEPALEDKKVCQYGHILKINPETYKQFVEDRISYQRELANIKAFILE